MLVLIDSLFKDKDDKIGERIISFVPDLDYLRRHKGDISHNKIDQLDKDFFGYLHYKDWEGKALFVLRIENGKAIKKYAGFIKNTAFNQSLPSQKSVGLMLFIGNANLTSWQAIKESSNNVINTNCDVE